MTKKSTTLSVLSVLSFQVAILATPWAFIPAAAFLIAAVVTD